MGRVKVPKETKRLLRNMTIGILAFVLLILISGIILSISDHVSIINGIISAIGALAHLKLTSPKDLNLKTIVYVFLGLVGTVLSFYVFYLIIDYVLTGKLEEQIRGVKTLSKFLKLKNHVIICGGGRVGQHVGEKLRKEGKAVVFVENNDTRVNELKDMGFLVYNADALNEKTLQDVGIKNAEYLAAVLGEDGDNLLLILTAKELNPHIKIAARANDEKIVPKLEHAGANMVILPEVLGGLKLADAMLGRIDSGHIIHLLKDAEQEK